MTPHAYGNALERVRAAIVAAAVTVDVVDVGGGFPSVYPGMEPTDLEHYFDTIHRGFESLPISYSAELRSEEHTSELQSLMRISYAVFCLKKKKCNIRFLPKQDFKHNIKGSTMKKHHWTISLVS